MSGYPLKETRARVEKHIYRTPVLSSRLLNSMSGAELFFKCDNFQMAGSYKIRGATNAILSIPEDKRQQGVATHSSGNFAQALSLASKHLGIPAYIVMPENAPSVKMNAVRDYGGKIITCPATLKDREETLAKIISETGATSIHPSNDYHVIMGQATMSAELIEEIGNLDAIVVPVGGGGILAGTCISKAEMKPTIEIFGAEPAGADDAFHSLRLGKIMPSLQPNTIADGLRTQLGDINFPIIQKYVKEILRVEDEDIIEAMKLIWERMKIIVEPSSAITFAAVLKNKEQFLGKKVGLIITGGNVSLSQLPF